MTQEQRLAEPVAKPVQQSRGNVDQLADLFSQLKIAEAKIAALEAGAQRINPSVQQTYPGAGRYCQQPQTFVQQPRAPNDPMVNVGAYSAAGAGGFERRCFYCFNQNEDFPQLHQFRNQCPWLQQHIAAGAVHINDNNKLCKGRYGEGGAEINLVR